MKNTSNTTASAQATPRVEQHDGSAEVRPADLVARVNQEVAEKLKAQDASILDALNAELRKAVPFYYRFSPEEAGMVLLRQNTRNRKVSARHVARLAEAMKRGEWKRNNASLAFGSDGSLLDGQHRMCAGLQSGLPFETLVVPACDPGAVDTIDLGKNRLPADALEIDGVQFAREIQQVCNVVIPWKNTGIPKGTPPSPQQVKAFYTECAALLEASIERAIALNERYERIVPTTELAALRVYGILSGDDPERVDRWLDLVCSGVATDSDAPNHRLQQLLLKSRVSERRKDRVGKVTRLGLIIEAYGLWLKDQKVNTFRFGRVKSASFPVWPEKEPEQ